MTFYGQKTGRLHIPATRSSGKTIDEWTFEAPNVGRPSRNNVWTVRVALLADQDGVRFQASCDRFPKQFLYDTDLQRLHDTLETRLQTYAAAASGMVWEDWLEVRMRNTGKTTEVWDLTKNVEQTLDIAYSPLKRGTHPDHPGRFFTINQNHCVTAFPSPKEADDIAPSDVFEATQQQSLFDLQFLNIDRRLVDTQFSYVPDTPEHRAALDHMITAMNDLGQRLTQFLRDSHVADNLQRLSLAPTSSAPWLIDSTSTEPAAPASASRRSPKL